MNSMDVDCGTCSVRGNACGDCVVSLLLGPPPELSLEPDERHALDVLADAGVMPPLRLVRPLEHPFLDSDDTGDSDARDVRDVGDDHGPEPWSQGQVGLA